MTRRRASCIGVLAFVAVMVGAVLLVLPRINWQPPGTKLVITAAAVDDFAKALTLYVDEHRQLPDSFQPLIDNNSVGPGALRSPFDPKGTVSYRYHPEGWLVPGESRRVILYCTAAIPDMVYYRGEPGPVPAFVPVVFDDLTSGQITFEQRRAIEMSDANRPR